MIESLNLSNSHEQLTAAHFDEYKKVCNKLNSSSRKEGILSPELYDDAAHDPSTTLLETARGQTIPAVVDVSHGAGLGYDIDRAIAYADGATSVRVMAISANVLPDEDRESLASVIVSQHDPEHKTALYYSDHDGADKTIIEDILSGAGIDFAERPLEDPRAAERQASLSLYVSDFVRNNSTGVDRVVHISELGASAQPNIDSSDARNATLLRTGDTFSPEELQDVWQLYQERFQYLGENHPISMEDSEQSFLSLFADPDTLAVVKYDDGHPVGFTYLVENIDTLYWLNEEYLKKLRDEAADQTTLFFPGIVAKGAGNSHDIIATFRDAGVSLGLNARILFENTNLSEMYIPKIVYATVNERNQFLPILPKKVDTVTYRQIVF